MANYIIKNSFVIKGINANKKACEAFMQAYNTYEIDAIWKEYISMDIMELRKLIDIQIPMGTSRLALEADIPQIIHWQIAFVKEALKEDLAYESIEEKTVQAVKNGLIYIYENEQGKQVSMAAAARKLINGISINYVYTPKEERGKGYASANMYALGKKLLEEGYKFCCLFVDKKNPISNKVYEKIGYVALEDNYDYRLVK